MLVPLPALIVSFLLPVCIMLSVPLIIFSPPAMQFECVIRGNCADSFSHSAFDITFPLTSTPINLLRRCPIHQSLNARLLRRPLTSRHQIRIRSPSLRSINTHRRSPHTRFIPFLACIRMVRRDQDDWV